jgi:uncharacterized protein (TIGR02680 family)
MTTTLAEAAPTPDYDELPRWRPSRAGLVSLWRYWDETFTFHGGRLLLRGPNGSGKSMALELLLPFLLDADASPNKLTSAAKSRGGLFDRVMTGTADATRTGFAWVEFRRGEEAFTVGARIRASQATRDVKLDFFTTSLAVGRDLHLLDADRAPLSRKALVEALGEAGRVHGSADDHRAAVREVLYPGFSPDRYRSVITALLALRKEKLSQHLDLAKLSDTLSESLPPVDDHDIAAVAEGFERLDRRRRELDILEAEVAEARLLAARQREYARAVVVGAARQVRSAETVRDDVTRAERQARADLEAVEEASKESSGERGALDERVSAIDVEVAALKDSAAYREGVALADLRAQASRLRQNAERSRQLAAEREEERATSAVELDRAVSTLEAAGVNLALAERDVREAAEAVGAEQVVGEAVAIADPDDAERFVHAWTEAQRTRVKEVRVALEAHTRAVAARGLRETQVADDEAVVDSRLAVGNQAATAEEAEIDRYRSAVEGWADRCETIGPARVAAALHPLDVEPVEVAAALGTLATHLGAEDAVARRDVRAERDAAGCERASLLAERARWEAGGLVDPEGPPWRSPRPARAGAPLWRLVDVRPEVEPGHVDGLEAALTGAGLLDAWVHPDGSVDLGGDRVDVVLGVRSLLGPSLADLVAPAPAAGEVFVPAEVVAAVLASVPVRTTALDAAGEAEVVVATDGTYRLGAATGRGPQRPALLLGAVARERHRVARLAEIDASLAVVDAGLAELDRREADLDRRAAAVAAELADVPSGAPVESARRFLADALVRLAEARSRLGQSRDVLAAAEGAVREALRALTARAARHSLPTDTDALSAVEEGITRVAQKATTWGRRRRDARRAEGEHERAAAGVAATERSARRARDDLQEAERHARAAEGRVAGLESSVGSDYADVVRRIAALGEERDGARRRERELAEEIPELERRVGALAGALAAAEAERARAEEERGQAQDRLVEAVVALADDAGIERVELPATATAVLAAARAIAADHEALSTEAQTVERHSERVREQVHAAQAVPGARVDLARELDDGGWWVLRSVVGGMRRGTAALARALASELEEGRAELAAEEERLFEQTLAGSVRRALAARIRQANALVDAINDQLAEVRTMAGGVQVRLRWEVDPEQLDAVKAARALLLRDPADLSEAERASLQAFVRARVDQARAELEANAPWEARLRETLDYRAWHRFSLQLAHRDWEGFQPATARRLQKLSTGERSIALHLPMIASVAAHYAADGGGPAACPRLILLDELFAGVDTANRAQLFGTFSAWDLDAVFTSDHEWCQYATLDGIAIHHLHPPTADEPVTSTRFTWDGRRRQIDPPAA